LCFSPSGTIAQGTSSPSAARSASRYSGATVSFVTIKRRPVPRCGALAERDLERARAGAG
jgi:hypothetical protein